MQVKRLRPQEVRAGCVLAALMIRRVLQRDLMAAAVAPMSGERLTILYDPGHLRLPEAYYLNGEGAPLT